ncbi:MAG: hypothetical protein KC502_19665 [Myxococcales bacterium]|nr:hypothetical protein [Myxococcales bacterium]
MKLYERMRRPPSFLRASNWMTARDKPIKAGPQARSAVIIPLLLMQYGSMAAKVRAFSHMGDSLLRSIRGKRPAVSDDPWDEPDPEYEEDERWPVSA